MKRVAWLVLAACSSSSPRHTTVVMTTSDSAPAYGTTPFPTDALREGDHLGTITGFDAVAPHHTDLVVAHVAALDGFGLRPLVEFFLDGPLDPSTVPDHTSAIDEAAALVDVDPGSPERGRVIAMDWHYEADRNVLAGSPASGEVLREGTRYAAFVTGAMHDDRGQPLARARSLDHLSGARWQTTADAIGELARPDLAGIAVFTTEHATAPLLAARAQEPAPTLAFGDPAIIFSGTTALDRLLGQATRDTTGPRAGLEQWGSDNPTGMAHDHVGVIGTGQMTIARFQRDTTGTNGPEDKTFSDPPAVVSIDTIPVTFILPAAPPPASGYPVVIYGHGLGAGRDQLLNFAEPLTSQGYAIVGIDMAGHGSRFDPTDTHNNLADHVPHFTGDPSLRDGFGDITGAPTQFGFFEGFLDVAAVRDSIRQSALDLGELSALLHQPGLDLSALAGPGTATPKLDTTHVAYLGESFGTVVGTLFAATEPAIDLYVLDVPGGGILDKLLPNSPEIGSVALPYIEAIYDPQQNVDRWNPLIALEQAVLDGGDPLSYATHVLHDRFGTLGARSVVCIEVVGDQVLPNVGTEALVRELGLDVLTPDLDPPAGLTELASPAAANRDGQTAVLVQYSPATHGANWSSLHGIVRYQPDFPYPGDDPFPKLATPVMVDEPIYETYEQVDEILATHQAGMAPSVRSTKAPVPASY